MAATPARLAERACAKVNLSLAVRGRRADGHHELDGLVAFADVADELTLDPGEPLSLAVEGPFAAAAGEGDDNLVLRAARAFLRAWPGAEAGRFRLVKHLPAAAGLGGGSADAAAALRLLARRNGLDGRDPRFHDEAMALGADVPVCIAGQVRRMEGAGERLGPALELPSLPAVLVNPGLACATGTVFRTLGLPQGFDRGLPPGDGAGLRAADARGVGEAIEALREARNDLEPAAVTLVPAIGELLAELAADPDCALARMSGSGATCFALCETREAAARLAARFRRARPEAWVRETALGPAR